MDNMTKNILDNDVGQKTIEENGNDDPDEDICSKINSHLNETYVIPGKNVPVEDNNEESGNTAIVPPQEESKSNSDAAVDDRTNGSDSVGRGEGINKDTEKVTEKGPDDTSQEPDMGEDKSKEDCEDSRGADSDSGRKSFTIIPCSFASLSAENSKDGSAGGGELTKFAHQDVDSSSSTGGALPDSTHNDTDPFAQMPETGGEEAALCQVLMDVDESDTAGGSDTGDKSKEGMESLPQEPPTEENEETITGDKSLAPESILEDPNIDVCIIEDSIPSDTGGTGEEGNSGGSSGVAPLATKRASTEQVSSDHAYTLPPGTSGSSTSDVEIVSETPASATPRKKTLKVIYPKKRTVDNQEVLVKSIQPILKDCLHCGKTVNCIMIIEVGGQECYLCSDKCLINHRSLLKDTLTRANERPPEAGSDGGFVRKCPECSSVIVPSEKILSWETMEFCMEECLVCWSEPVLANRYHQWSCLGCSLCHYCHMNYKKETTDHAKYQNKFGSHCANCKGEVGSISLGKYCVRFGYDIKQFCQSSCLEDFKKGLKVCSYCQKDISENSDGFLAAVGDGGQFKDFCSQMCMESYDRLTQNSPIQLLVHACDVCYKVRLVQVEVILDSKHHKLCSDVCFAAFKFVNTIKVGHCDMCKKYYDKNTQEGEVMIYYEDASHSFCSKSCMNIYILSKRKIVPCSWCKVKKYNFDMIKKTFSVGPLAVLMCSLNCLALYRVSVQAVSSKKTACDMCSRLDQTLYHLTMSDASFRNFCSYECVMNFQALFKNNRSTMLGSQPTPTGHPKRILQKRPITGNDSMPGTSSQQLPVISSVGSLKPSPATSLGSTQLPPIDKSLQGVNASNQQSQNKVKLQILVKPPAPKQLKNKVTQVRPNCFNKATTCKPHRTTKVTQTDEGHKEPILIPVPVPVYVPVPVVMYSVPVPTPVPFPLPIPVPIFIPTSKNSTKEIMEDIKRIQEKIPKDPYEAELLMMAEMVAGDKKANEAISSDSDHDPSEPAESPGSCDGGGGVVESGGNSSSAFGEEDMLQMALKMATELDAPPPSSVELEHALGPNNHNHHPSDDPKGARDVSDDSKRGLKRSGCGDGGHSMKKLRRSSPPPGPGDPDNKQPKHDSNPGCLKYILGVNAYKQWANMKNAQLEKSGSVKGKAFKTDVLQQTTEELNYSLSLFIEEARRPDGSQHTPDTLYYLCLGIQHYLHKNGRVDNIFTDAYYEKFTDCLNSIARKFSSQFDNPTVITTRVREEHLWESRQLGVSSPHVLLTTLMYFNTKYFNLSNVEEHMQLSFSHIMKHWKKNSPSLSQSGPATNNGTKNSPTSGSAILRFFPPQSVLEANPKKKKVYEQVENEENPYRCPVKLYEFYLSKCPESVKVRNDVFYLKPESSCVPDSPVWYSTTPLSNELLEKMLNLICMVKEVNVALLSP